jgi:hypothetical protein
MTWHDAEKRLHKRTSLRFEFYYRKEDSGDPFEPVNVRDISVSGLRIKDNGFLDVGDIIEIGTYNVVKDYGVKCVGIACNDTLCIGLIRCRVIWSDGVYAGTEITDISRDCLEKIRMICA